MGASPVGRDLKGGIQIIQAKDPASSPSAGQNGRKVVIKESSEEKHAVLCPGHLDISLQGPADKSLVMIFKV